MYGVVGTSSTSDTLALAKASLLSMRNNFHPLSSRYGDDDIVRLEWAYAPPLGWPLLSPSTRDGPSIAHFLSYTTRWKETLAISRP